MLRPAEERDRDAVRVWRNHPAVRAVSLTRHEISAGEHAAWWAGLSADATRRVLVYDRGGVPSGAVNFFNISETDGRREAWWGFFLDVQGLQARGELLPAWFEVMKDAVDYAVDELRLDVLHGEVLMENEGVRAGNRRARIREVGIEEREIDGEKRTVIKLQLLAADVHARRRAMAERARQRTEQEGGPA